MQIKWGSESWGKGQKWPTTEQFQRTNCGAFITWRYIKLNYNGHNRFKLI